MIQSPKCKSLMKKYTKLKSVEDLGAKTKDFKLTNFSKRQKRLNFRDTFTDFSLPLTYFRNFSRIIAGKLGFFLYTLFFRNLKNCRKTLSKTIFSKFDHEE